MTQQLELPDIIYKGLMQVAKRSGTTPADWIAAHLPGAVYGKPSLGDVAAANARLRAAIVDYGAPLGLNNEELDADLSRAYGDTNE